MTMTKNESIVGETEETEEKEEDDDDDDDDVDDDEIRKESTAVP